MTELDNIVQLAIYLFEQIYSELWKINILLLETTTVAHSGQRYGGNTSLASHLECHRQACNLNVCYQGMGLIPTQGQRDRPYSRQASLLLLSKFPLDWVIDKTVSGNKPQTHSVYHPTLSKWLRMFLKNTYPQGPLPKLVICESWGGFWKWSFLRSVGDSDEQPGVEISKYHLIP